MMTTKYRRAHFLFALMSFLCNVAPLATYIIMGLAADTLIYEKVALTMTVFVVLLMSLVAWLNHLVLKSRLWILLLGIYVCLDFILIPLIIIACCQILDELIISPLRERYREKLTISKEMDKRGIAG